MSDPVHANYLKRSTLNLRGNLTYLFMLALALLGVGLVFYLTRDGAGASGDSAWYIMGAQNLLDGNGYSRFSGGGELRAITVFPPAYSLALAAVTAVGITTAASAQILNAVLFGANLSLTALLIYRVSQSGWAAAIGTLLVLTSTQLIESHSWIMSEPLYIFLSLLAAHLIALGVSSTSRRLLLVAGAVVAGATLTRFAGFSLLAAGIFCILLLPPKGTTWRIRSGGLFAALGLIPVIGWMAAPVLGGGSIANRQFLLHALDLSLMRAYQAEAVAWVFGRQLPLPWRPRAVVAGLIAFIGPIYFLVTRIRRNRLGRPKGDSYGEVLPWFLGSYLLAYAAVLILNSLFLDAGTPAEAPSRYLIPAYVALVILSTITTTELIRQTQKTKLPAVFALSLGLLLISLNIDQSLELIGEPGLSLGYVGIRRTNPELANALDEIDLEVPIISNNPETVYIITDRPAYLLPTRIDPHTQAERLDYQDSISAQRKRLESGAVLVIFGTPDEMALEAMNDLNVSPLRGFNSAAFYIAGQGLE
jgi:hypothetical protein